MLLEMILKASDITINIFITRTLIIIALLELTQGYYSYFYYKNKQTTLIEQIQVKSFFVSSFIITGLLLCYFLFKVKTV